MSVTVAQIREGLATNLAALTGVQVLPYLLANPSPPTIHMFPASIEYDLAMSRGLDMWTITVQAFIGMAADRGAQVVLDQMLAPAGSQSVKTLLESDNTLAGLVQDVNVTACSGYRQFQKDNSILLGADWTVEVLSSGK